MPLDLDHVNYLREKAIRDEQFALTDPLDRNPNNIKLAKAFGAAALRAYESITQDNAPQTVRLLDANITAGEEILRRYREEYIPELRKSDAYRRGNTSRAQQAVKEQVAELKIVRNVARLRFG